MDFAGGFHVYSIQSLSIGLEMVQQSCINIHVS